MIYFIKKSVEFIQKEWDKRNSNENYIHKHVDISKHQQ